MYAQPLLRKPSRIRVVDDVRQSLENAILSGAMRPGERLLESRLAEDLGVSRTTVREALLMLIERGLAVGVPRRGAFVARLSKRDALEVSMLRSLLEGLAVSAASQRLNRALLDHLAGLLPQFCACELPRDIPRVIEIDREFHTSLVEAAEMPRLRDLWGSLNGPVAALMLRSIETKHLTLEFLARLHEEYIDELRSGDHDRMVAAVSHHYVDSQAERGEQPVAGEHPAAMDLAPILALAELMARDLSSPNEVSSR